MKIFLIFVLVVGPLLAADGLATFGTIPVIICNDTSDFFLQIIHNNSQYDIPVIKEKYQLSGVEIPFIFFKQNNDKLHGCFAAYAYVLRNNTKEYIENSNIVIDLCITAPKDATKLKRIFNDLFLIKLHYSLENDWQMKFDGSSNTHFAFKHQANNENK